MRVLRFFLGIFLVPFCVAATLAVTDLARAVQPDSRAAVPPSAWAMVGGFLLWLFLYYTVPRPVRSYVLAHELTHALWGALMGARVSQIKVSEERGSVTLSKSNFLITLAPYFFPLYTVLVILVYLVLSAFVDVEPYAMVWLALVGFTWGFHVTFTASTLLQRQSDIREYGHAFSYALIYLLNVVGVGLWIVMVSPATLEHMVSATSGGLASVFRVVHASMSALARAVLDRLA